MNQERSNWARLDAFARRHPVIFFLFILTLAFLTQPLMIAANNTTAVLYKAF